MMVKTTPTSSVFLPKALPSMKQLLELLVVLPLVASQILLLVSWGVLLEM
jgi:ABC-type spermidine/putrescine transport system permease subunit I